MTVEEWQAQHKGRVQCSKEMSSLIQRPLLCSLLSFFSSPSTGQISIILLLSLWLSELIPYPWSISWNSPMKSIRFSGERIRSCQETGKHRPEGNLNLPCPPHHTLSPELRRVACPTGQRVVFWVTGKDESSLGICVFTPAMTSPA